MSAPPLNHPKQAKRAEFEALQEAHEAKHKEISARGRMALADFLLGTSDMTSPAGGGRTGGLATVMEEGSPRGALGWRWRFHFDKKSAPGKHDICKLSVAVKTALRNW